jgi:hypothetical protein
LKKKGVSFEVVLVPLDITYHVLVHLETVLTVFGPDGKIINYLMLPVSLKNMDIMHSHSHHKDIWNLQGR